MKLTFDNEKGQVITMKLDIDDKIEDIDSVAQVSYDCSWPDLIADRILELADECSNEVGTEYHQQRARRLWDELHPPRPVEVIR